MSWSGKPAPGHGKGPAPQKERALYYRGIAQLVTMDTRPQCGVVLSDSAETGYELGIRTVAVVWRLGCLTVECPARRYPG